MKIAHKRDIIGTILSYSCNDRYLITGITMRPSHLFHQSHKSTSQVSSSKCKLSKFKCWNHIIFIHSECPQARCMTFLAFFSFPDSSKSSARIVGMNTSPWKSPNTTDNVNTLKKTLNTCDDAVDKSTSARNVVIPPFKMAGPMSTSAAPALLRSPEGSANL